MHLQCGPVGMLMKDSACSLQKKAEAIHKLFKKQAMMSIMQQTQATVAKDKTAMFTIYKLAPLMVWCRVL